MSYGPRSDQGALNLKSADLISRCVEDTGDTVAWREFVRRFQPKIELFIRGTLRDEARESQAQDLVQNVILRLVENTCIVLRRFSGSTDDEFHKYLAVISRSVVRDSLRRQRATKRSRFESPLDEAEAEEVDSKAASAGHHLDREILAREVASLGARMIREESGEYTRRDQLIFDLHYKHGLSSSEIAECSALGLSKSGVIDVLARLTDRLRTAAQAR
jgi:RNA polymerase sigma factor (sigma-70 family)